MSKEFFDIEITFAGKAPAPVNNLTREQMEQVKRMFDAAPGERMWRTLAHRCAPPFAWKFSHVWRRALRWMAPLVFFALTLGAHSAVAQDGKARAIEPIRVSLETGGEAGLAVSLDRELRAALRRLAEPAQDEQRKPVDVAFVTLRADYDIAVAVARIDVDGAAACAGLVASMTITDVAGKRTQSIHSGRDVRRLAEHLSARLDARYFQPHKH